jgi:hydrogenase-4 component E
MEIGVNSLVIVVILLNFLALGSSQIGIVIRISAIQGIVLGLMPLLLMESMGEIHMIFLGLAIMAIKGALIPSLLFKAMRDVKIRREVEPLLGFIPSMFLGALGTILGLVYSNHLPLLPIHKEYLILPGSFSAILTGFIMLITRHKAITQVVGFLILENGIFVFALLLLDTMPFLAEIGVLLDVFVCIFVLGIIMNHIQKAFSSLDSNKLTSLKE